MERLGAAIVGCGGISATYGDLYTRFPDDVRLVAFCDVVEERARNRRDLAREKARAHAGAWRKAVEESSDSDEKARLERWARIAEQDANGELAIYTDYERVVQDEKVNLVVVCTPPPAHAAPSVAALQAGKHVFCQGPMATALRDADAMIEAARSSGAKLSVQYLTRFTREAQSARAVLQQGWFGKLILSGAAMLWHRDDSYYSLDAWRGTWRGEGGGAFFHHARYVMDLYLWCLGTPVAEVFAWADTRTHRIEVEDVLTASLRFRDGSIGQVSATVGAVGNAAIPRDRVEVFGERGSLSLLPTYGKDGWRLTLGFVSKELEQEANDWLVSHVPELTEDPTLLQTRQFLACIRDDTEPPVSGESARAQLELARAAYAAAETGSVVRLPLEPGSAWY